MGLGEEGVKGAEQRILIALGQALDLLQSAQQSSTSKPQWNVATAKWHEVLGRSLDELAPQIQHLETTASSLVPVVTERSVFMRVCLWIVVGCSIALHPHATLGQTIDAQAEFRKLIQIVPIDSTAGDVRELFGEPLHKSPDFYQLRNYNLMITYASGLPCANPCYEGRSDGWNVPRDKVITVAIFVKVPFHQCNLENVGIDLITYKKWDSADHIPETIYYSNAEKGIGININGDQVNDLAFFPATKYFHLRCPRTNDKPACETHRNMSDTAIDNSPRRLCTKSDSHPIRGLITSVFAA